MPCNQCNPKNLEALCPNCECRLVPESDWQPIETLPEQGEPGDMVVVFGIMGTCIDSYRSMDVAVLNEVGEWETGDGNAVRYEKTRVGAEFVPKWTHWLPLPLPPAPKEAANG